MPGFELGDDLACRWSLRLGPPFQPGGAASWVAPARTAAGDRVVLKVGWWHDEAAHEADGLRAWDGAGTVRLLGSLVTGSTSALPEARSGGSLSPRDSCFAFVRAAWWTPPRKLTVQSGRNLPPRRWLSRFRTGRSPVSRSTMSA
jgi:hypothetical protein